MVCLWDMAFVLDGLVRGGAHIHPREKAKYFSPLGCAGSGLRGAAGLVHGGNAMPWRFLSVFVHRAAVPGDPCLKKLLNISQGAAQKGYAG